MHLLHLVGVVLILHVGTTLGLSCQRVRSVVENTAGLPNEDVDWWMILKSPQQVGKQKVQVLYHDSLIAEDSDEKFTSDLEWKSVQDIHDSSFSKILQHHATHVDPTTQAVYDKLLAVMQPDAQGHKILNSKKKLEFLENEYDIDKDRDMKYNTIHLWFNDQVRVTDYKKIGLQEYMLPNYLEAWNRRFAHSKLLLAYDIESNTGFVLSHTLPKAPQTLCAVPDMKYPKIITLNSMKKSQHLFCYSFGGEQSQNVLRGILLSHPRLVTFNLPPLYFEYHHLQLKNAEGDSDDLMERKLILRAMLAPSRIRIQQSTDKYWERFTQVMGHFNPAIANLQVQPPHPIMHMDETTLLDICYYVTALPLVRVYSFVPTDVTSPQLEPGEETDYTIVRPKSLHAKGILHWRVVAKAEQTSFAICNWKNTNLPNLGHNDHLIGGVYKVVGVQYEHFAEPWTDGRMHEKIAISRHMWIQFEDAANYTNPAQLFDFPLTNKSAVYTFLIVKTKPGTFNLTQLNINTQGDTGAFYLENVTLRPVEAVTKSSLEIFVNEDVGLVCLVCLVYLLDDEVPTVCFGDSNHRYSEVTHAGTIVCVTNTALHKFFRKGLRAIDNTNLAITNIDWQHTEEYLAKMNLDLVKRSAPNPGITRDNPRPARHRGTRQKTDPKTHLTYTFDDFEEPEDRDDGEWTQEDRDPEADADFEEYDDYDDDPNRGSSSSSSSSSKSTTTTTTPTKPHSAPSSPSSPTYINNNNNNNNCAACNGNSNSCAACNGNRPSGDRPKRGPKRPKGG